MHEDFGTRIRVKVNAPELLEKFFRKNGLIPINREKTGTLLDFTKDKEPVRQADKFAVWIGGGVCDVYQPAEEDVGMMRTLLKLVLDYGLPVFTLTKNSLVLRDLDLLKKINEGAGATVAFTITLADDGIQKIFEPRASTTSERFQALKRLNDEGIHTGIWALPLLPWIGDTDENMTAIYQRAKEAGVEWIISSGLTLKPGRQKEEFFRTLGEHFPGLVEKYSRLYSNNNKYGQWDAIEAKKLGLANVMIKGRSLSQRFGIRVGSW